MAVLGRAAQLSALLLCLLCTRHVSAAVPSAGEKALVKAILSANNTIKKVTLTADITLTARLPRLQDNATLVVQGACKGRRCAISGADRFPGFGCARGGAIVLQDLKLTRFRGGAIVGGCFGAGVKYGIIARRVTFSVNYNSASGGAIYSDFVSAQISSCEFLQNSAGGSGGAIRADAGTFLNVFNSSFEGNAALRGSGGAISGVVSSVRASAFERNVAGGGGGGAISSLNSNAFFVAQSSFSRNRAQGLGGALYLIPTDGPYWLCNATFERNRAATARSADVYAAATAPDDFYPPYVINLCGGTPPAWVLNNNTAVKTCVGCTGCSQGDCHNKGACVDDPVDANPSCVCKPHYTPNSYCVQCEPGYAVAAKCRKCAPGYNPRATAAAAAAAAAAVVCEPCSAIATSGILPLPAPNRIVGGGPAPSYRNCAAQCAKLQDKVSPVTGAVTSCQWWAYFDSTAPAGCKGTCVMWNEPGTCMNSTAVVRRPKLGLYTAHYVLGGCGP